MTTSSILESEVLASPRLPISRFSKLLISALCLNHIKKIDMSAAPDIAKISKLKEYVDSTVEELREKELRDEFYFDLVSIRNLLSPSPSGAYDRFEQMLRDEQIWITNSQNPTLDRIQLDISPKVASHLIDGSEDKIQEFIFGAAKNFL